MQLDVDVSPPANDLQMSNFQIAKELTAHVAEAAVHFFSLNLNLGEVTDYFPVLILVK